MPTDTDTMLVKPATAGLIIRFPDDPALVLPEKGAAVPRSPYWLRRLADGSIIETPTASKGGK